MKAPIPANSAPSPGEPRSVVLPATDSTEWLRVTLSSIGDGVIAADPEGRVTFMNPVAQALTGWQQEEAAGVSLTRVFHIVNQDTRKEVENPVFRALKEGVIVGLANHTLLIAKDGTERHIDDSAAPIRSAGGQTVGAVLVFHDVSERKRHEDTIKDALEYASNILDTQRHPFLVLDKALRIVSANRAFYKTFHTRREDTEGRLVHELGDGQWNIPELREFLAEIVPRDESFDGFEVEHEFPGGVGRKIVLLNARRILRPGNHSELLLLAIEDVTSRKRDETLLTSQKEVLELVASGAALGDVLHLLAGASRRYFGEQSRATVFMLEPDGAHLRFEASAGMPESYTDLVNHFEVGPQSPSCGSAAHFGRTIIVPDVTQDPLWAPYLPLAKDHDIVACWSHPIQAFGGEVLGTIAIYHRVPREPGPGDLEAIMLLGHTAAIVIEKHRELAQRQRAEAELHESETRFRRLFETAKDGILILDARSGKITDANDFMCGLTGMDRADILGKELYEIGMFKDIEENKESFRELQRTGYLRHDHLPVQNRRGEKVEVEFIANVYHEGRKLVAQCNVRDIGDRSRLEKQVGEQAESLAAQSRGKDEFLAMLSHELRNPLAPIRSAVHLLRLQERAIGNPIQQQAREIIERQVANLTKMVSDLLEVSRVVSGRIRLDLQPADLREVVEHSLQTAAPLFQQRKHIVTVSLCPDAVWAQIDPTRIEEVLVNLLTNAAKYTPDGGTIQVLCEQNQSHALIRVRDSGVGIDKDLLPRIFDLFTQADRSLARSAGGLGIGLSLAHRLVDMHGGTIAASSPGPGKGSEFSVTLPLIPEPAPVAFEEAGPVEELPRSPDGRVRVLVVDDNVDLVAMLMGTLRHKGYSVQCAYTGPEGLKLARQWRPDVVLLDIGLPGLDGYEVARRLRADPAPASNDIAVGLGAAVARMKLIALTGYGQDSDIAMAREAGFDGHMVKPCDFDELEKMMAAPTP